MAAIHRYKLKYHLIKITRIAKKKFFFFLCKIFIMNFVNYVDRDEVQKLRATKGVKEIKLINFSSIIHSKKLIINQ